MTRERVFEYRADGSSFWSIAGVLLGLIALESGAALAAILILVDAPVWKWSLAAGVLLLLVTVPLRILLAPLRTRHSLTGDALIIHYGRSRYVIPRAVIASAVPVQQTLDGFQPIAARRDDKRNGIIASFSEKGQILLEFREPQDFRAGSFDDAKLVDSFLFNVDERDELLAELSAAPGKSEPPAAATRERAPVLVTAPVRLRTHESDAPSAILTTGLSRTFGEFRAVDELDLSVRQGEIYGFLGLNGAGKTTSIKMLVGLLAPSAGTARIAGFDVWREPLAAKAALGYVPDRAVLYDRLSGREFLRFIAQVRGLDRPSSERRIEDLLETLELHRHANVAAGNYSFGMKRKLSVAAALLHEPSVLILDEPFNGLDPRSAHRLKELFAQMTETTTIFLSTHDLATAEAVCNRVGILHRGRLIAEGPPAELRGMAAGSNLETVFLDLTREEPAEVLA